VTVAVSGARCTRRRARFARRMWRRLGRRAPVGCCAAEKAVRLARCVPTVGFWPGWWVPVGEWSVLEVSWTARFALGRSSIVGWRALVVCVVVLWRGGSFSCGGSCSSCGGGGGGGGLPVAVVAAAASWWWLSLSGGGGGGGVPASAAAAVAALVAWALRRWLSRRRRRWRQGLRRCWRRRLCSGVVGCRFFGGLSLLLAGSSAGPPGVASGSGGALSNGGGRCGTHSGRTPSKDPSGWVMVLG
jgi:hypothetical protein